MTHNNGVSEGASVLISLPLSVNVIIIPPIERLSNVPRLGTLQCNNKKSG
jgi:hypothetical protein